MSPVSAPRRWWHRLVFGVVLTIALLSTVAAFFWLTLPRVGWLQKENPTQSALMQFRRLQAEARGETFHCRKRWVPLWRISPHLIQAVLIAEDDKFFQHEGFDWEAMRQALEMNIRKKKIFRGGSTITQQLAKNLFLSPQQTVLRKVTEAAIAVKLEKELTKKRILELYLNIAEWGDGIFGAEAASRAYFDCPAAGLTPAQAIRLASILPNPHRFSPYNDRSPRLNRKRRMIAYRLLQRHWIESETYQQILANLNRH